MGRTTLEYDDRLLRDAQRALGTKGIKATVERAMREAVREAGRQELLRLLREGRQIGPTPEELERLRAPYLPEDDC